MLPSIFNDNLFDDFFNFPFYDDKAERRAEKKLYGHHAHNLMKTDIKEKKDGYELEMDLPGFKKDEITAELKDGYMTISAAKGFLRSSLYMDYSRQADASNQLPNSPTYRNHNCRCVPHQPSGELSVKLPGEMAEERFLIYNT